MLESIITDYLERHRRLVVPTLGAFLKKEGGQVVFAPFLNKDDGILVGLVGQSYGASVAEAQGIIGQYTDNIRRAIDETGAYLFAPLGALKRDANGILFLDMDDMRPQSIVEEEVVVVREAIVEEIVVPEPAPEVILEPAPAPESEPRTLADTLEQPRTLNDLIREQQEQQQTSPRTVHQQAVEATEEPKPVEKPAHRPVPKPTAPPASPRRPAPAKPEKRGDVLLIVAIVVAIVAVAALIYGLAAAGMPAFDL